jgi:PAB1-binding protein PBP1
VDNNTNETKTITRRNKYKQRENRNNERIERELEYLYSAINTWHKAEERGEGDWELLLETRKRNRLE